MNIAIICGGLPRLNQDCIDSFYEKVLLKLINDGNYVKFFISVDSEHLVHWNSFNYHVDKEIIVTNENFKFSDTIFSDLQLMPVDASNYYNQYRHLYSSLLNLQKNTLSFDYVFKIRLDMMYVDYLKFDLDSILPDNLYVPDKEFHEQNQFNFHIFCNDQFYFGDYATMNKVLNFSFDKTFKIYDFVKVLSYPSLETMLRIYLHFKSIKLNLVRHFLYYKHLDLPGKRGYIPPNINI
jgi:hypothetical protein